MGLASWLFKKAVRYILEQPPALTVTPQIRFCDGPNNIYHTIQWEDGEYYFLDELWDRV